MYFEDLTQYEYCLPYKMKEVKHIGWLENLKPYRKGGATLSAVKKLKEILRPGNQVDAEINLIRGFHPCNICEEMFVTVEGGMILGRSEIWVPSPGDENYYASPSMIIHYMEVHEYFPPEEFMNAVLAVDVNKEFSAQAVYNELLKKYQNMRRE